MESDELIYTIIRTAVDKGIHYIEENPKRGVRNLVDLGEYFATGRFQKDFFEIAHEMLNNEDSSYYQLIENTVKNTNHETLLDFGMNLGYNSWTYGAKIIRQHEAEECCNIPWTVVFNFEKECKNPLSNVEITDFISCCKKIGIYCYMFMIGNNLNSFEDLLYSSNLHKNCAFVLFVDPNIMTSDMIESISKQHNIAVVVSINDETDNLENKKKILLEKTNLMLNNKCIYGVYKYYDDEKIMKILSGEFTKEILKTNCTFAFLIKKEHCSEQNAKLISEYVKKAKAKNNSPVFLMDFYEDIANIDRNISDESCFLSITSDGCAIASNLYNKQTNFNIRYNSIEQILSNTISKFDI